ncbi:hypothetical protein IAD21_06420 (plasmid) [Abditibacteriota bacterium]|nr:hypothetical protein IAD21_06420 [Abditibacteriota bacterium]
MTFHSSLRRALLLGALLVGSSYAHAATFTVSNLNDSGEGSLRLAILDANATPDADTIDFTSGLTGTITLTNGEIAITDSVDITGLGADALTVSGNDASRIFNISAGTVSIRNLALSHGYVKAPAGTSGTKTSKPGDNGGEAQGGAILNRATLTVSDVVLSDNKALGGAGGNGYIGNLLGGSIPGRGGNGGTAHGGTIYNSGTLTIDRSRFENNNVTGGKGGPGVLAIPVTSAPAGNGGNASGGAIFNTGTIAITNTTFKSNTAIGGAGGDASTHPIPFPSTRSGAPGIGSNPDVDSTELVVIADDATFPGAQDKPFRGQLLATGDQLTYSLVSGTLPSGLTLDPTNGLITGVPTGFGDGQIVTFQVSDGTHDSNIATVTFNIAQTLPELSVNSPSVREGNGGPSATPSQLVFTLTLSKASQQSVSVIVQTAPGTNSPATAKSDYVPLGTKRVTFAPGQTQQIVAISIVGDTIYEDNEYLALLLSSPSGITLATTTAEGTIINDDPLPALSINDVSVPEGNRSYTKAIFTVTRLNASDRSLSVNYSTLSYGRGVAIGGTTTTPNVDYLSASGTLTFLPGQTSKTITVYIKGDTLVEGDEPFLVRLSAPVNARLADSTGLGIIQDDDSASDADSSTSNSIGES